MSFASAVVELLIDGGLYDRIRRNAMDHLSRHFTPVQVAYRISNVLEELDTLPVRRMSMSEKARFLGCWSLAKIRDLAGKANS